MKAYKITRYDGAGKVTAEKESDSERGAKIHASKLNESNGGEIVVTAGDGVMLTVEEAHHREGKEMIATGAWS